jgi:hypothetical protein
LNCSSVSGPVEEGRPGDGFDFEDEQASARGRARARRAARAGKRAAKRAELMPRVLAHVARAGNERGGEEGRDDHDAAVDEADVEAVRDGAVEV